jgi:hypothetical protein
VVTGISEECTGYKLEAKQAAYTTKTLVTTYQTTRYHNPDGNTLNSKRFTDEIVLDVTLYTLSFGRSSVHISAGILTILIEVLRGFP